MYYYVYMQHFTDFCVQRSFDLLKRVEDGYVCYDLGCGDAKIRNYTKDYKYLSQK